MWERVVREWNICNKTSEKDRKYKSVYKVKQLSLISEDILLNKWKNGFLEELFQHVQRKLQKRVFVWK